MEEVWVVRPPLGKPWDIQTNKKNHAQRLYAKEFKL